VDASNATVSGAGEAAQHPGGVTGVVATSVMCAYAFSVLERDSPLLGWFIGWFL